MLLGLQIYFILASFALLIYGMSNKYNAAASIGHSLFLNIFPLFWVSYYSMDSARFIAIPLAYLPVLSSAISLIRFAGLKLKKQFLDLALISIFFLMYTLLTSIFVGDFAFKNFMYWVAWLINFLLFFGSVTYFSKIPVEVFDKVIRSLVIILVLGCLVGYMRFILGVGNDSNFMPVINRNGTVLIVVMLLPMLFYLHSSGKVSNIFFIGSLFIVFVCLVFMFSRSGIIGFFFGVFFYYFRFSVKSLLSFGVISLMSLIFLSSGFSDNIVDRLLQTFTSLHYIINNLEMDSSMSDVNRVMLLKSAISIINDNFWFGTGVGLDNYRQSFLQVSDWHRTSKSHNFYLSYFAELGFFGMVTLLYFFFLMYRKIALMSKVDRTFKVIFLVVSIMMTMNEYILLPYIWLVFGMLLGIQTSKCEVPNFKRC